MSFVRPLRSFFALIALGVAGAMPATQAADFSPTLVKDIRTETHFTNVPFDASNFTSAGNLVFFTSVHDAVDNMLWVSDGTQAGTRIVTTAVGQQIFNISKITAVGNRVYFVTGEKTQLWVSDGTPAGTSMVAQLHSDINTSNVITLLTPLGDELLFVANSDQHPLGVWRTDGTPAGTFFLKEIFEVRDESVNSGLLSEKMQPLGKSFYFTRRDPLRKLTDLCKTDGTQAGTQVVHTSRSPNSHILGVVDNQLLLHWATRELSLDLWTSDGTAAGTLMMKAMTPSATLISYMTLGGKGYFFETSGGNVMLWETNGKAETTSRFILNQSSNGMSINAQPLANQILFYVSGGADKNKVQLFNPANGSRSVLLEVPSSEHISGMVSDGVGAYLQYTASGVMHLYYINGAGEPRVTKYEDPAHPYMNFESLAFIGSEAYFSARAENRVSPGIYATKGTAASTRAIWENVSTDSFPQHFSRIGDRLYFSADDGVLGRELWVTEGTPDSTQMVVDLSPGSTGSDPMDIVQMGQKIYFTASSVPGSKDRELWVLDPVTGATTKIKTIMTQDSIAGAQLSVVGARLVFVGSDALGALPRRNTCLWVSDGTAGGTRPMRELYPQGSALTHGTPAHFTPLAGKIYFTADMHGGRGRLYSTDGTAAGTDLVESSPSYIQDIIVVPPSASSPQPALYMVSDSRYVYSLVPGEEVVFRASFSGSQTLQIKAIPGKAVILGATPASYPPNPKYWILEHAPLKMTQFYDPVETPRRDFVPTENGVLDIARYLGQFPRYPWQLRYTPYEADPAQPERAEYIAGIHRYAVTAVPIFSESGMHIFDLTFPLENKGLVVTNGSGPGTQMYTDFSLQKYSAFNENSPAIPTSTIAARLGNQVLISAYRDSVGRELFALPLDTGLALSLRAETTTGLPETELIDQSLLDFGSTITPRSRTLRLYNVGNFLLENITLTSSSAQFEILTTAPATIPVGRYLDIEVKFAATVGASYTGTLVVEATSNGSSLNHSVNLTADQLSTETGPGMRGRPQSKIVTVGDSVTLSQTLVLPDELISNEWHHNRNGSTSGVSLDTSGAEPVTILSLSNVNAEDAASYRAHASTAGGTTVGPAAYLAVAEPLPATHQVHPNSTLSLTCTVHVPEGSSVAYQWLRGGLTLSDVGPVTGSRTATLQVRSSDTPQVGQYSCQLTFTAPDTQQVLTLGTTLVTQTPPPLLFLTDSIKGFSGDTVDYLPLIVGVVTSVEIKGLPRGLTYDRTTGRITGKLPQVNIPKTSSEGFQAYTAAITATGPGGVSDTVGIPVRIFIPLRPGNFTSLLPRAGELDGGLALGSLLKVTSTGKGTLSGTLQHGGKTYRFSKVQSLTTNTSTLSTQMVIPISRGKLPALRLQISTEINAAGTAQLSLAEGTPVTAELMRCRDKALGDSNQIYTWSLNHQPAESDPENTLSIPAGYSAFTGKLSKSGLMNWRGRLADGSVTTGSAQRIQVTTPIPEVNTLEAVCSFNLYGSLYKGTGSINGVTHLLMMEHPGDWTPIPVTLTWNKAPLPEGKTSPLYPEGIPLHNQTLIGNLYNFGYSLSHEGQSPNNRLELQGPVIDGEVGQSEGTLTNSFLYILKKPIKLEKPSPQYFIKSLSVNTKAGTFQGTVEIRNQDQKRTAPFYGILNEHTQQGEGFTLLPDLSDTSAKAPKHSCRITLLPGANPSAN